MLLKCKYCGLEKDTKRFGMTHHENECYKNPNRKKHNWEGKKHKPETIIKIGKNNRMGHKNPNSILDVSSRTASKILKRLSVPCSICGWNKSSCDIHHIIPHKDGGSDSNSNLCILCPNCHRLVHTGFIKQEDLINLDEYIGDKWKELYFAYSGDVS